MLCDYDVTVAIDPIKLILLLAYIRRFLAEIGHQLINYLLLHTCLYHLVATPSFSKLIISSSLLT